MKIKDKEIKKVWEWRRIAGGYWRPTDNGVIRFTRGVIAEWRADTAWLIQGHPVGNYYLNAMRYW